MPENLVAMQHGSYLIAALPSQPFLDRGEAVLYRGVQIENLHITQVDNRGYAFKADERSRPEPGRFREFIQRSALQCVEDRNRMLQRPELFARETLRRRWSRSQAFDHIAALFRLCIGGMVRRKEVWAKLREVSHAPHEYSYYDICL